MLAGMSDRFSAVEAYRNALIKGDVAAHLAPGVDSIT
jgi:hypothetical protein